MAERRSISKNVVINDVFVGLPINSRCLYFHLCMEADNDGILINPKAVTRSVGADYDDLNLLITNKYITPCDNGIKIVHWELHKNDEKVSRKRLTYSYRKWRECVLKRDKYVCQIFGSPENLNAHHKKSFSLYPELREDVDNGITLCENCHRKLHELEKGV